ncbi:MAG: hypothetical protein F6K21_28900, partial [Symploca sp. SIO2D2]|nr:hypothetical protein [Symploca sp. SIO2D2]
MVLCVVLALGVCAFSYSRSFDWDSPLEARRAIEDELGIVEEAKGIARHGNLDNLDRLILSDKGLGSRMDRNVMIGQRAVGICSWLKNQNDYRMARAVARRALAMMSQSGDEKSIENRLDAIYCL